MKKPTRDEAIAAKDRAERELFMWERLYHDLRAGKKPDAFYEYTELDAHGQEMKDYRYRLELWRVMGAEAGILVLIFKAPNQSDTIRAYNFDEYAGSVVWASLGLRIGIERLMAARRRIYDSQIGWEERKEA